MSQQGTGDPRAQFLSYDTGGKIPVQAPSKQELEEKVALLKDIAPGFGEGFIEACLVACKGDAQQASNMLLENKFPEPLNGLDRQLAGPTGPDISMCTKDNRAATETGDPRAAWMGAPLKANAPPGDAAAAAKKVEPDTAEAHTTMGMTVTGDPRASWLDADTTTPKRPAHGNTGTSAEPIVTQGHLYKTGDPRAQ